MLYSSLTNAELLNWLESKPEDAEAVVELVRRAPLLLANEIDAVAQLQEANAELQEDVDRLEKMIETIGIILEG